MIPRNVRRPRKTLLMRPSKTSGVHPRPPPTCLLLSLSNPQTLERPRHLKQADACQSKELTRQKRTPFPLRQLRTSLRRNHLQGMVASRLFQSPLQQRKIWYLMVKINKTNNRRNPLHPMGAQQTAGAEEELQLKLDSSIVGSWPRIQGWSLILASSGAMTIAIEARV